MKSKPPEGLANEPDSDLKYAAILLWEFAKLHGLCMDLCGKRCAQDVLEKVDKIYPLRNEKKEPSRV